MRTADPTRYARLPIDKLRNARSDDTRRVASVIDGDRCPCPYHRVPLTGCRSCLIEAMLDELIDLRRFAQQGDQLNLGIV